MARPGHVYVMQVGHGRLKVGFSRDPAARSIILRRAPVLHTSRWDDRAELIEKAAQRLLRQAGKHIANEEFAATLDEALDAIQPAEHLLASGELEEFPNRTRKKKMAGHRLDAALLDRVEAWRLSQDVPPSTTAIFEQALREFLDARTGVNRPT